MSRILVVDDDMFFRKVITKLLTGHGYEIFPAESGEEALWILQTQTFDLMISDVNMTPMNGMALLEKVRESYAGMGVIMLTGHDEIGIAIEAMKKGAFDFLVKPFQLDALFMTVQRSLEYYSISPENRPLQARLDMLDGLVAESPAMRKICDMIRRVAPANVTVLLSGEPGTEKEIIARAIHYYSQRKDSPFMVLDCSALPAERIEPELFGMVGGALAKTAGLLNAARGGTLFIDNIDALPLNLQPGLLNVIQTGKLRPGSSEIDVRIVAASSEKLDVLAARGAFNENLYYRLSALHIEISPLRSRLEDLPALVDQSLCRNLKAGVDVPSLDAAARDVFYSYTWPGNMRELDEAIRFALSRVQNGVITKEMLPEAILTVFEEGIRSKVITSRRDQFKGRSFKKFLREKQEKLLGLNVTPPEDKQEDAGEPPAKNKKDSQRIKG